MIAELTVNHTDAQRARAYSLLQVVFGLGGVVGSALGASAISSVGWLAGFLFMNETLDKVSSKKNATEEETHGLLAASVNEGYSSFDKDRIKPSLYETLTPPVLIICLTYGLFALQNAFYDELFPIWAATQRGWGGLEFNASEIGAVLSVEGLITLFVPLFVYHHLVGWFGSIRLFRFALFVSILAYLFQNLVGYLYQFPDWQGRTQTKYWVWIGLLFGVSVKTVCQTVIITGCLILVNNAVPRPDALGFINGFSQCCSSVMRAFGPAMCGIVWSS
ncbi:hypothetical protein EC973_002272 [Apophysomyces ossiformis]|uniref:Major facilitator superfamily (MFS) profile domain-containing protein n=1 Tax=Apophysomyces ossiformis TaxID=679940 RepID=A0A8H7BGX0_9FUNG|nr:hypothetical protein EC973_002272 [Apophysomyces ossiformis]